MKIEKLSNNSIQIDLSVDEMEKRSLSISKLNIDAPAYKELVQNMISYAEIELGYPISAVKVDSHVADDCSKISFVVESMRAEDIPAEGENVPQDQDSGNSGKKKIKEQPRPLSPVFKRIRPRQNEASAGSDIPTQENPGGKGFDLTAELMRRMMIDSYLFIHASAMKAAMEKGESGVDGSELLKRLPDELNDTDTADTEDNSDQSRESLSKVFDMRRKMQFGEEYEENGGTGVIAFASYDDLYAFLKGNSGLENCRSKLYEYNGVFYLQILAGKKSVFRLNAIDSLAAEYRGVCVPDSLVLPILEEYAEVVFERSAMKKIRESLG